jgi:uncharacterized protein YhaN
MKIRTLFLKAFGPFTDSVLDFSGAANLHLIYGPNEAGKSSALRAMADLRYGIPPRSKDDFVHGFKTMLLAGCFEDMAGQAIGVARRKGNKDTLTLADESNGDPIMGSPLSPDILLALTGGVAREQFATMYGLDSEHLRTGGQLLVSGEGELGAALFEASTGASGIKGMLETLQADAKKYFAPRGQSTVLNEASRLLEDSKQRFRHAVTKPDQWKALNRAHEQAKGRLDDLRRQLAAQRRRVADLTELRAVEPLLKDIDLETFQWSKVEGYVELPAEAREYRLRALQEKKQAQAALADAEAALAQCAQGLQALQIEESLLAHAAAIDRLRGDFAMVHKERDARLQLEASVALQAKALTLQAARIAGSVQPDIDAFFLQTPSTAARAELDLTLEQCQDMARNLQQGQAMLGSLREQLAEIDRGGVDEIALPLRQALSLALAQAQSLGNAEQRLSEAKEILDSENRKLDQALGDLKLASAGQLTATQWLPASEIDAYERERAEWQKQRALTADQTRQIQSDLAAQKLRHKAMAAAGEVVSADTLGKARAFRDAGWLEIRKQFIDPRLNAGAPMPMPDPTDTLPDVFERASSEADRQADLLREGAQRAAEVAECEQRITDMTQTLSGLQGINTEQAQGLAALDADWQAKLARLGIPGGSAAAVRDWLALRQSALELRERAAQAGQLHRRLEQQIGDAVARLGAALIPLGLHSPDRPADLAALTALGVDADRKMLAAQTTRERQSGEIRNITRKMNETESLTAGQSAALASARAMLDGQCRRLFLADGASQAAIKARLAEYQAWADQYRAYLDNLGKAKRMAASAGAVAEDAQALAQRLKEPAGDRVDTWLDGLMQRLQQSRQAAAQQETLEQRSAEAMRRRNRAQSEFDAATKSLDSLLRQAGAAAVEELEEAERRSGQRRVVFANLASLRERLDKASVKDICTLRGQLVDRDSIAIDAEKQECATAIDQLELDERVAIAAEQAARASLNEVDTSGEAAQAREEMESSVARYRAGVRPWAQLKLAEALLAEALRRYRERAQGPVIELASDYFRLMTGGRFLRLMIDTDEDEPALQAQPSAGKPIGMSGLSEGTADQLHLALRLASLHVQRKPDRMMPLVLDDVFMTSDDERAADIFRALAKFAAQGQVLVFTHHSHLIGVASSALAADELKVHHLSPAFRTGGQ